MCLEQACWQHAGSMHCSHCLVGCARRNCSASPLCNREVRGSRQAAPPEALTAMAPLGGSAHACASALDAYSQWSILALVCGADAHGSRPRPVPSARLEADLFGAQLRCPESSAVRALHVIPGRVPLQSFTPVNIKQGITDYDLAPKYQLPPLETHMQNVNWYEIPILIY